MASEESFVVLVHHRGSVKRKTHSGVKFTDKDPLCIVVTPTTSYDDLVRAVLIKLGLEGAKRVMFLCRRQFLEVRTPELLARLVDVVSSSGGSNRNATTLATPAGSSSRPAVASSSVPVYQPVVQPAASPSFAVDLNGSVGDEVGARENLPNALLGVAPVGVGDGLLGDAEENDVEPDMIDDDNGDDIGASEPALAVGFGARDAEGTAGLTEFQVGQQFQDKDEALLSVKTYVGKCSEFGNGCTWLIRLSLRQRKGIWEVKRYNGPHTCLATSISSDHRSLDYHVISAFIMPMVRADTSVSIKVLLNATAAHFGFRPTYRRVWMAKQKANGLIYGDCDESYNDLPRWVLGVQLTMPGIVAVLRTNPVRVGGQLDESQSYFHKLFWTFPPCMEAFRHCKPLINIDGTHLYGKYGGTLLIAIAQDGNSNILPVAFALVEGENAESWTFFLSHLRQQVTPQPGLLVISDSHNGIKAALEAPDGGWLPPSAYRAFCIRHVAANFALTFKGKDAQRLLVNAAYAKTEVEFDYWVDILRSEDPVMCEWANRIDYSLWTQHRDEGRRFGHMTTNISKCVNSILKGVRNLPVSSLVKATYGRLAELFVRKGKEAEAQMRTGQQFS
ncbi:hypothetical protein Ahy_A09g043539 isoform A [Arachis hypogaea]|uniref:MULE transposase domain-containing protein n=1 Tax=Arachis hypogaea TaxID=3818 RepID=A0A445BIH8_ARAHY|nr:hypothetical protein Ahy_A09g043539 isoform A [Arachis hypogaea]